MTVKIDKGKALQSLSLTPLIDVVFLLIIFFLVATKFEEEEREMDVLLPEASEAQPITSTPKELIINIDEKGTYLVNRQQLDADRLLGVLRQRSVNNPGRQTVLIRADHRCPWQFVMNAMNLCNKAHIYDYRVSAEPVE